MDFNYSPEDEAFRHEFRAWLEQNAPKNASPRASRWDDGKTTRRTGTRNSDGIASSATADGPA